MMGQAKKMVSPNACSSQKEKWETPRHKSYRYAARHECTHIDRWEIYHSRSDSSIRALRSSCYDDRLHKCLSDNSSFRWDCSEDCMSAFFWFCCSESCTDIPSTHDYLSPSYMVSWVFHEVTRVDTWWEDRFSWSDKSDRRRVRCVYRYVS